RFARTADQLRTLVFPFLVALDRSPSGCIVRAPVAWGTNVTGMRTAKGRDSMRARRVGTYLLGTILLSLPACETPNPPIKPPLHEEYTLPPVEDSRFSLPPTYPKETLDNNQFKKDASKNDQFKGPGGRLGAGPGGSGVTRNSFKKHLGACASAFETS